MVMTRILSQANLSDCVQRWLSQRPLRIELKIQRILASLYQALCSNSSHGEALDRMGLVSAIHALWELALQPTNHPMLLSLRRGGQSQRAPHVAGVALVEKVLHYICSTPGVDSGMDVERSLQYVCCGYISALLQSTSTLQALLELPKIKSVLIESLFVALKRIPDNSLLSGKPSPTCELLLRALVSASGEIGANSALFRSNGAYAELLLRIVDKSLNPCLQLLATQVVTNALTALDSFEEQLSLWSKVIAIVLGHTFVVLPTRSHDLSVNALAGTTLREAQLFFAAGFLAYVKSGTHMLPEPVLHQLLEQLHGMVTECRALLKEHSGDTAGPNGDNCGECDNDDADSRVVAEYQTEDEDKRALQVFLKAVLVLIHAVCEAVQQESTRQTVGIVRMHWKYWALMSAFDAMHESLIAAGPDFATPARLSTFQVLEQGLLCAIIHLSHERDTFLQSMRRTQVAVDHLFSPKLIAQRRGEAAKVLHAHLLYLAAMSGFKFPSEEMAVMLDRLLASASDEESRNVLRYLAAAFAFSCTDESDIEAYFSTVIQSYQAALQDKADPVITCFINHGLHLIACTPACLTAWNPEAGLEDALITSLLQSVIKSPTPTAMAPLLQTLQRLVGTLLERQEAAIKQTLGPKEHLAIQGSHQNLDHCVRLAVSIAARGDRRLVNESLRLLAIVSSKSFSFDLAPSLAHPTTAQTVIRLALNDEQIETQHLAVAALLGLATFHFDSTVQIVETELLGLSHPAADGENLAAEEKFVRMCLYFLRSRDVELQACGAYLYSRHRITDLSLHDFFRKEKGWSVLLALVRQSENARAQSLGLLALIQATEVDKQNQRAAGSKHSLEVLAKLLRSKEVVQHTKVLVGALIRNLLKHANNRQIGRAHV